MTLAPPRSTPRPPLLDETRIAALAAEARLWRREFHACPELLYDLPRTSARVAELLESFGCDAVHRGIATSGVVAEIGGAQGPGPVIALRADMDALPIHEQTNLPHASKVPGMMHACGHDGHMAMLLATAAQLAASRDFAGKVVLVFQPAEEGGAGARRMLDEGLIERFGIESVFGLHNQPGLAVGHIATRPGALMAGGDRFMVTLTGQGGHAASPHLGRDPVLAMAHLVTALQSIASRFTDPLEPVVVSVTHVAAGDPGALNVIPGTLRFGGTIRTLSPETRAAVAARFREAVELGAKLFGIAAAIDWRPGYPVTVNDPERTRRALAAARRAAGAERVEGNWPATMGSEDFSYMLERRPGAMVWLGNGDSADLHNAGYDFNDAAIAHGMRYWLTLVAQEQAG